MGIFPLVTGINQSSNVQRLLHVLQCLNTQKLYALEQSLLLCFVKTAKQRTIISLHSIWCFLFYSKHQTLRPWWEILLEAPFKLMPKISYRGSVILFPTSSRGMSVSNLGQSVCYLFLTYFHLDMFNYQYLLSCLSVLFYKLSIIILM